MKVGLPHRRGKFSVQLLSRGPPVRTTGVAIVVPHPPEAHKVATTMGHAKTSPRSEINHLAETNAVLVTGVPMRLKEMRPRNRTLLQVASPAGEEEARKTNALPLHPHPLTTAGLVRGFRVIHRPILSHDAEWASRLSTLR